MTKEEALYQFFNGFGIPAYPATAVPPDAVFPWITYDVTTGSWRDGEVSLTVNIWYYTSDEAEPTAKARELEAAIPDGGVPVGCDGGFVWLKRGSPWCQNLTDDTDSNIKRRYINVSAEYMTN